MPFLHDPGTGVAEWVSDALVSGSVGQRFVNTATETIVASVAGDGVETAFTVQAFTIPADTIVVGTIIRVRAQFDISVSPVATTTATINIRLGGVGGSVLSLGVAKDTALNDTQVVDILASVVSIAGVTATYRISGWQTDLEQIGAATLTIAGLTGGPTVNTSIANVLNATVQFDGNLPAGNTTACALEQFVVEVF
jgi:hypothetical protein